MRLEQDRQVRGRGRGRGARDVAPVHLPLLHERVVVAQLRAAELLNIHAKPLNGARVLLLGVTYKKDIADQRESPARPIARKLLQRGAVLSYHDPYVDSWQVDGRDIPRAASPADAADLTILLQAHSEYDLDGIAAHAHLLLDTRGSISGESVYPL